MKTIIKFLVSKGFKWYSESPYSDDYTSCVLMTKETHSVCVDMCHDRYTTTIMDWSVDGMAKKTTSKPMSCKETIKFISQEIK